MLSDKASWPERAAAAWSGNLLVERFTVKLEVGCTLHIRNDRANFVLKVNRKTGGRNLLVGVLKTTNVITGTVTDVEVSSVEVIQW